MMVVSKFCSPKPQKRNTPSNTSLVHTLHSTDKPNRWWWQIVILYVKACIAFVAYGFSGHPVLGLLFSMLVFMILWLLEILLRPWKHEGLLKDKIESNIQTTRSLRNSWAPIAMLNLQSTLTNAMEKTTLSKFSGIATMLCLLTAWCGIYFHFEPTCAVANSNTAVGNLCNIFAYSLITAHIIFIFWALRTIFKTRKREIAVKKKATQAKNLVKNDANDNINILNTKNGRKEGTEFKKLDLKAIEMVKSSRPYRSATKVTKKLKKRVAFDLNRKRAKTSNNDNNEIARSTGLTFKKQIKKQSNTGVTIDDDVVMLQNPLNRLKNVKLNP